MNRVIVKLTQLFVFFGIFFPISTALFAAKPNRPVINDLIVAISMPSYPYPFEQNEAEIRRRMAITKDIYDQSTRGALTLNYDLDKGGKDLLFHVFLNEDIDPCANLRLAINKAVDLAKLQKPGIEFNHRTLMIRGDSCAVQSDWSGIAIGGDDVVLKDFGEAYSHELGHNIGFPHTNTDPENDNIGSGYGRQDPMEEGGYVFFNAPHVWGKKWFGDCPACFQDWAENRSKITISPLGTPPPLNDQTVSPRVLIARIADDDEPGKYYFISYRAPVEGTYEVNLRPEAQTGVSIHHASGGFSMTSLIHVMKDNETYLIPNTKITINQHSHDLFGANISVNLGYKCAMKEYRNPNKMAWGNGSLKNPFAICTGEQLSLLSQRPKLWKKVFMLGTDIDLADLPFTSIGRGNTPFSGKFFGNSRSIKTNIKQPLFGTVLNAEIKDFSISGAVLEPSGEEPSGIIAQTAKNSVFKNIILDDFTIAAKSNVGAIIGIAERSTLFRVSVKGEMTYDTNIENVGGLVGNGSELVIDQSKVQLVLQALTPSQITNVGSLAGQLNKSSVLNSYAKSKYYLWLSKNSIVAVGSLVGRAANVLLKQVYFSGKITAGRSANPSSLVGYVADDPTIEPNTVLAAQGALLTPGNRGTLVGESATLDEMYSADFLLSKGYGADIWQLGDSLLPQFKYDFDPAEDGPVTAVD